MGDTLDGELERLRHQEAERRAVDRWNRRYGAPPRGLADVTTVQEFSGHDRVLVADFLRRVGRGQLRRGFVIPHPDGSVKLLTRNYASVYTVPLVWLWRRRDGEKVAFVEIGFSSGLEHRIRILADGVRFAGFCPRHLAEVLASALVKRGR